eukprot:SAG22_NODE_1465_length_4355_cov_31.402491_1_plen_70_part_00
MVVTGCCLQRFYDVTAGGIYINGTDIKDFNPPWIRRQMAIVRQDPVIVPGDIRTNLLWGQVWPMHPGIC